MTCCNFRFFFIILLLGSESGSSEICSFDGSSGEQALPICSSSSRTGHTILIETSLVSHYEAIECNCSVEIDSSAQSVHVLYKLVLEWADTTSCGLHFKAVDRGFQCQDVDFDFGVKTYFWLEFSKTAVNADACFVLMIDRDATDKSNATVTCFETGDQTTTSVQTSAITTSDHNTNKNSNTSTETSSMTTASSSTLTMTSANKSITNTDTSAAVNNALTKATEEKPNTVVIAAAAGAGGGCLLIIGVTLVYCYYRRMNKKTSYKPDYVNTTNTAMEAEVTENVLYDMEFPEDKKEPNMQLNDLDVTYNTVDDDTYHAVDDNMGTQEKYALSSTKDKCLDNDTGIYNTVEDDKYVDTQKGCIHQNANVDTGPAYKNLELPGDIRAEGKNASETQNNDHDITYSVVNKKRCKDAAMSSGYQRPKQLEVADSGDTYAIVEKGSNS